MFHTIIVPLDGSARAEQALPIAAGIAREQKGSLVLLRVVTAPRDYDWHALDPSFDLSQLLKAEHSRVEAYLQALIASTELDNVEVHTAILDGNPADAILAETLHSKTGLLVMCSHGESGHQHWRQGSVSWKVARHSTIPVLILHSNGSTIVNTPSGTVRILVPLDGSASAEEALVPAAFLAQTLSVPARGALHLTCVLPLSSKEQTLALQAVQSYLAKVKLQVLQSTDEKLLTITSSITFRSDVALALIELAEQGKGMETIEGFTGCDLIAMTTHGRSGIARWMMGSVTERVLGTTKLPLLIVRSAVKN